MSTENPGGSSQGDPAEQGFSFNDRRRIDPETGEVRATPQAPGAGESVAAGDASAQAADSQDLGVEIPDDASTLEDTPAPSEVLDDQSAKHLEDLQRLNAEYASYRRRAARDQDQARAQGAAAFAEALIPVLDEVKLAEDNGDVTGAFAGHVAKLKQALGKVGFEQYGEVGEEFDPTVHEALMQQPSDEVSEPTVFAVMQPGYRIGDRVLRAARVGVHAPAE